MALAETLIRQTLPSITARTFWMFGLNLRLDIPVTLRPTPPRYLALPRRAMLLPDTVFLPVNAHTLDILNSCSSQNKRFKTYILCLFKEKARINLKFITSTMFLLNSLKNIELWDIFIYREFSCKKTNIHKFWFVRFFKLRIGFKALKYRVLRFLSIYRIMLSS